MICNVSLPQADYTLPGFPVFMGTVDSENRSDPIQDLEYCYCRSCGCLQLKNLADEKLVYARAHGSGTIGETWSRHHKAFARFVMEHPVENILEVGGGGFQLARELLETTETIPNYWIVEPNPSLEAPCGVRVIRDFLSPDLDISGIERPTLVHSHFFEHLYNPEKFLKTLHSMFDKGTRMIFSIPNLDFLIKNNSLNAVNFEHTYAPNIKLVRYLLEKCGFELEATHFFENHSIFISCILQSKASDFPPPIEQSLNLENNAKEYLYHLNSLRLLISNRVKSNKKPLFIFGAHITAQLVLYDLDLSTKSVVVLDNDPKKVGNRLSGTNLFIEKPTILINYDQPEIVTSLMPIYANELESQCINLNKNSLFFNAK